MESNFGKYVSVNASKVGVPSMINLATPLQPANASTPMLVTLLGIVIEVRPLQYLNASFPMLVTLFGIVTDVRPLQPRQT